MLVQFSGQNAYENLSNTMQCSFTVFHLGLQLGIVSNSYIKFEVKLIITCTCPLSISLGSKELRNAKFIIKIFNYSPQLLLQWRSTTIDGDW